MMLSISDLHSGYGETQILRGVNLDIAKGEIVAVLGRNGVGKSTLLKTIMGLLDTTHGEISFNGEKLNGLQPYEIAARGVAYVPETRDIFSSLSVLENLELPLALNPQRAGNWTLKTVFDFFPQLASRKSNGGAELSGGEQQMLSLARALLMNPQLLILDEPTEGLAPVIIEEIHSKLLELKQQELTILMVEQNFGFATRLADRCCVMGKSIIQWSGTSRETRADRDIQQRWLGV